MTPIDLDAQLMKEPELEKKNEMIHKRMNEIYLRGTDEYGQDFQICFDSYDFLGWIDTDHLEYIKEQLIKYIKTK